MEFLEILRKNWLNWIILKWIHFFHPYFRFRYYGLGRTSQTISKSYDILGTVHFLLLVNKREFWRKICSLLLAWKKWMLFPKVYRNLKKNAKFWNIFQKFKCHKVCCKQLLLALPALKLFCQQSTYLGHQKSCHSK